jgi:predicted amidophosphoribosyltransferase
VRELILQPQSSDAAHDRDQRPRPAELEARYVVDRGLVRPKPQIIGVVDDLMTTGAHFVAIRNMLRREFPDTPVMGIVIARRVPEAAYVEDFES